MKRSSTILLLLCLLVGCSTQIQENGAEALQEHYAAPLCYNAEAKIQLVSREGDLHYTLHCEADGERICVQVLEPEELAGIAAQLTGEELALSYEGIVLDAGQLRGVNAVNALPLVLRAVGEGYLLEQGVEDFGDVENALRVCFEGEHGGKTLRCTLWFDATSRPLGAEIAENEEIIAFIEFTKFEFGDIINNQ